MRHPSLGRFFLPVLAAIGILVAAFLVLAGQPNRERTDPPGKAQSAPPGHTRYGMVAASGIIEPSSELTEVGAPREGVVTQVLVQAGDRVSRGQLLFTIENRDTVAQVAEARAGVAVARSRMRLAVVELDAAQSELKLYTDVEDPRAVSEQQVIDRRSRRNQGAARLDVARAEVLAAEARLASAQTIVGLFEVRSPINAEVLQIRTRPGEYAAATSASGNGEPLMVLGETKPLHLRIDIDESEIDRTTLGAPAVVSLRGSNKRLWATFVRAEPLVVPKRSLTNNATERVDVRVLQVIYALPTNTKDFFVGQQVDAYIPAKKLAGQ